MAPLDPRVVFPASDFGVVDAWVPGVVAAASAFGVVAPPAICVVTALTVLPPDCASGVVAAA